MGIVLPDFWINYFVVEYHEAETKISRCFLKESGVENLHVSSSIFRSPSAATPTNELLQVLLLLSSRILQSTKSNFGLQKKLV